jgi:1-aminocyclopropane-1-carboxylate deaminase
MELSFLSREEYKNQKIFDYQTIKEDSEKLMIPEGGKGDLAMKGCAEMLDEPNMKADYYIVSTGTGTTAMGLANGLKEHDLQSIVIAIACVKDESLKSIENPHLKLLTDFAGKGFAKFGEQEVNTTKQVYRQYGFILQNPGMV